MQDNQKKYRKKYAVMTVFFLISASFLFGCGNKDSAVPETEEFLFSAEEEKSDHTSQKSEEPAEKAERKKAEADSGTVEENPVKNHIARQTAKAVNCTQPFPTHIPVVFVTCVLNTP